MFVDFYTYWPTDEVLLGIEGVKVIELPAPTRISGKGSGIVGVIGEVIDDDGKPGIPQEVGSSAEFEALFGGFSSYGPWDEDFGYEGLVWAQVQNKRFYRLIVIPVDQEVGKVKFTVSGMSGSWAGGTLPAGSRVKVTGENGDVFATLEDVYFSGNVSVDNVRVRRVSGTDTTPAVTVVTDTPSWLTEGATIAVENGEDEPEAWGLWDDTAIKAAYAAVITSMLGESGLYRMPEILFSARSSTGEDHDDFDILDELASHADDCRTNGIPRVVVGCFPVGYAKASAKSSMTDYRTSTSERFVMAYPGVMTTMMVDGEVTTLYTRADSWVASCISQVPPHVNPGVESNMIPRAKGLDVSLEKTDYIGFRNDYGIAAIKIDPNNGACIQSGINTCSDSTLRNIHRRRVADYIIQGIVGGISGLSKQPLTDTLKEAEDAMVRGFLEGLVKSKMIKDFRIDTSVNTPAQEAKGIWIMKIFVQTIPSADALVLAAEIGETVDVSVLEVQA